jgi:hypothetical protein
VLPPTLENRTNNGQLVSPVSFQTAQRSNQTAIANRVLTLSELTLVYGKLNYQAIGYQEVVCAADPETKLIVPPGTLFEGFTVNINIVDMTDPQETNAAANPLIGTPADTSVLTAFQFLMLDREDRVVNENGFKADVELVFRFHAAAIAAQGWDTERLAIFYWKPTTREWIPVGGTVDPATGTIRARVGYLHGYYAVMQLGRDSNKAIRNVVASPNPFTPGRGTAESARVKLSFSFNQPYPTYEVKIFNMRGQMVYQRKHDGSYAQGEVFWDGSNLEGFRVPGGVYVYQVIAGDNVFSGSILVLR